VGERNILTQYPIVLRAPSMIEIPLETLRGEFGRSLGAFSFFLGYLEENS